MNSPLPPSALDTPPFRTTSSKNHILTRILIKTFNHFLVSRLPGGLEKTHKTFFDPTRLREPHFFDGLFRGILHQPQQLVDDMFSHSVTWFLNPKEGFPFGKDLVSLNIQRGRDHALPSYNHYLHLNERHVKNEFSHFGAVVNSNFLLTNTYTDIPHPSRYPRNWPTCTTIQTMLTYTLVVFWKPPSPERSWEKRLPKSSVTSLRG